MFSLATGCGTGTGAICVTGTGLACGAVGAGSGLGAVACGSGVAGTSLGSGAVAGGSGADIRGVADISYTPLGGSCPTGLVIPLTFELNIRLG